jgi:hypothetical protein
MSSLCRGRCRDGRSRIDGVASPCVAERLLAGAAWPHDCWLALRCRSTVGWRCVAARLLAGAALPHTPRRVACRAVGPRGRLRCDARGRVAPPNSLRSLRSLRSDNGGESVDEARCARRPSRCASRRPRRPRAWGRAATRDLAGVASCMAEAARASLPSLYRHGVRKEAVRAELVEALLAKQGAHQVARTCVSASGDDLLFVNHRLPA